MKLGRSSSRPIVEIGLTKGPFLYRDHSDNFCEFWVICCFGQLSGFRLFNERTFGQMVAELTDEEPQTSHFLDTHDWRKTRDLIFCGGISRILLPSLILWPLIRQDSAGRRLPLPGSRKSYDLLIFIVAIILKNKGFGFTFP
jgi:hypothetical protein